MVRSMFGDYMMFLSDQPSVKAQDTTEIKNLLKKIDKKSIELQRAIQKVRQARMGDDKKKEIDAAYEEQDIDFERKQLVDKVIKLREKPMQKAKPLVAFKPAPAKKVVAKKVMKSRPIPKPIPVPTKFREGLKYPDYTKADKIKKISDNLRKLLERDKNNPEMKNLYERNLDKLLENDEKFKNQLEYMKYVPEIPAPKKVVPKKVMKAPAKKVVAKKVMKPAMKKPMKKPIAFGNVETALTGKRPRKAPAKPTQVARFYVGGSVLPKGQKVAMPKKTTTTMKARKPMSAETKQKIKNGVKAYHKNCKKAMAMYSKMKK